MFISETVRLLRLRFPGDSLSAFIMLVIRLTCPSVYHETIDKSHPHRNERTVTGEISQR